MKYSHTRLLVSDFNRSFRFYRDVLGFRPTFGAENDVYADFDAGGSDISIFVGELMSEAIGAPKKALTPGEPDRVVLNFMVDSVDRTYQDLSAKGVVFVTSPQDRTEWGIRTAHFRDPDGNLLEICKAIRA